MTSKWRLLLLSDSRMSKVLPVFLILASFVLSSTVLPRFNIGVMFDVPLIMIICYGLVKGEVKGAFFGLVIGFVCSVLMASLIGFFTILSFVTGYVCGIFREDDSERSMIVTVLIVLGIVFAYQMLSYIGQAILMGQFGFFLRLHTIVFPKTILTTALFVPIYLFVNFVRSNVKRVEMA